MTLSLEQNQSGQWVTAILQSYSGLHHKLIILQDTWVISYNSIIRYDLLDDTFQLPEQKGKRPTESDPEVSKPKERNAVESHQNKEDIGQVESGEHKDELWISVWDEKQATFKPTLNTRAERYHKSSTVIKNNHPLKMMVDNNRMVN